MRAVATVWFLPVVFALLPPGYEDELYCPPAFCKMRKTRADEAVDINPESDEVLTVLPKGFVGPASMFHYCLREVLEVGGTDVEVEVEVEGESEPDLVQVTPWGSKFGEEVKAHLLEQGFHTLECPGQPEEAHPDSDYQGGEGAGQDGRPYQPQQQAHEEWFAGPQHWAAIIGIGIAVWWFKSTGGGGSEAAAIGGGKPTAQRPNAEEMRKRRLEALGRSSSSIPETSTSTGGDGTSEGLRQRGSTTNANASASGAPLAAVESKTNSPPAVSATPAPARQTAPVVAETPAPSPVSATAPAPVAAPEPVTVPTAVSAPTKPPVVPAEPFSVKVRGAVKGNVAAHSITNLHSVSTIGVLRQKVRYVFLGNDKANAGMECRLFFNEKELNDYDATVHEVGLAADASVQALFTASAQVASAPAAGTSAPAIATSSPECTTSSAAGPAEPPSAAALSGEEDPDDDSSHVFALRAQGTLKGSADAHMIEGLRGRLTVFDLERRIAEAFSSGDEFRIRLFYMGRELNDGSKRLVDIKFKGGVTVQVMFSPGRPRHLGDAPAAGPVAGVPQVFPMSGDDMTNEAVMAAAAAAGCNPNALLGGAGNAVPIEVSPEEAWRALGALQEQLARATDMSEDAQVRQASLLLKNMLTSIAADQNSPMMIMAQSMVPDLGKIWGFQPTREYLCAMLNGAPSSEQSPGSASGSASAFASS